jgi:hypothetical protein
MSNFMKWITKNEAKRRKIMLKLSGFRHNHHPTEVRMLAKFIRCGFSVKRLLTQITAALLLATLLALLLAGCSISLKSPPPTPMPSPNATIQPFRLPDPGKGVGSCSSGELAALDVVDTWSLPEAASITPLSCDEIG